MSAAGAVFFVALVAGIAALAALAARTSGIFWEALVEAPVATSLRRVSGAVRDGVDDVSVLSVLRVLAGGVTFGVCVACAVCGGVTVTERCLAGAAAAFTLFTGMLAVVEGGVIAVAGRGNGNPGWSAGCWERRCGWRGWCGRR